MEKSNYIVAFGKHQEAKEWTKHENCAMDVARNKMVSLLLKKITAWVKYQQQGVLQIEDIWENKYGYSVSIKEKGSNHTDVYLFKCFDEIDIYRGAPDGIDMMNWIWGNKANTYEVHE